MVKAEREPIMEVWGPCPSGFQGQNPWAGVQGRRLKLTTFQ